jgi:hypothetical protein
MPHYGLTLVRGDVEERGELLTEVEIEVGEVIERLGERWLVESIEASELGRFEAWLVCRPALEPLPDAGS